MRSNAKRVFYFQAQADSLGGFIERPFEKIIPSQSSVSLPPVGGYAATRSHEFNFEEIVSCSSAYTRVSGSKGRDDAPWSALVTGVIEDLNILEVVTAERVVSQISADYPAFGGPPRYSLVGSHFEGLRIAGQEAFPAPAGPLLYPARNADAGQSQLTLESFQETAREQADRIVRAAKEGDRDANGWLVERFGWLTSDRGQEDDRWTLCSLVDGVDQAIPGRSFGHVVEIPDFGTVFLAELLVSRSSIQLTMIRAELGCAIKAEVSGGHTGVGGHTVPPS
jgi:hypothetical protein